ncbi:MAG TPA: DUF2066 domain-containing protein [Stellaceae bacterium]|nr:DUF2066 domain-containing protein [Stellaceae bacterium]
MRRPQRLRHLLAFLAALAAFAAAAAATAEELYRAQASVTGQGEAERARGFAICLEAVLIKVSGDPRLAGDPALDTLKAEASRFVAQFTYRDRMAGIPVHDEQGTRERPFELTVDFDPSKIDALLRSLGRDKWPEPRPRLAVLLGVRDATTAYVLSEDGGRGLGEREALSETAARRGIPIALPNEARLAADRFDYASLAGAPAERLAALARENGGDAALTGTLVWSDKALGWIAAWQLSWQGREHRWRISGVSFDDAFRDAIDHAAAILSGQD